MPLCGPHAWVVALREARNEQVTSYSNQTRAFAARGSHIAAEPHLPIATVVHPTAAAKDRASNRHPAPAMGIMKIEQIPFDTADCSTVYVVEHPDIAGTALQRT